MSRKDAVVIASRVLSVFFTISALCEVSYLPEFVNSYLHYNVEVTTSAYVEYMHHYYLLRLGFLVTRIIGFVLMARWLHKGGAGVEELLLPSTHESAPVQS
jgi:hypothetical protein